MNKKGFTLIELLAVIVILGIVLVVTIPLISDSYSKSKLKSEEIFIKRLSEVVDEYVKLNSSDLRFGNESIAKKNGESENITVWSTSITVQTIITSGLLKNSDYVNAGNKSASCSTTATIVIYKDSDGVYCHSFRAEDLGCISDKYKDANDIQQGDDIVNTCIWTKVNS